MTDGTVGPRVRLSGDFEVGADIGRRAGGNLFHSFERFSLAAGERATFSGPAEIRNVIGRVTGGEPSDIDGTLRPTIPGADFYFISPAGVTFGPSARLDVQGAFHVSTADELRFADGATCGSSPASWRSARAARSAASRAGTVVVDAPEVDLSGGLVVLEGGFVDSAELPARCGARRDIGTSSFTGVGRGGLPATPDAPLASAYLSGMPTRAAGGLDGWASVPASFEPASAAAAPCLGAPR